jgi:hypothetical protein
MQPPYKLFSNYEEIESIQYRLQYKGLKSEVNNNSDFAHRDLMAFVYYNNEENRYRMRYLPFRIEDGIFYWPYGKDKKVARILLNKEKWDSSFEKHYLEPLKTKEKDREQFDITTKDEKINQIRKSLAVKDQLQPNERELLDTCELARQNLLAIASFFQNKEVIDRFLLELKEKEVSEAIVHSFVQLPASFISDYGNVISPEYVEQLRQFAEKYEDEGLSREEQIELFQTRQKINVQILDELQRRQKEFESILQTTAS